MDLILWRHAEAEDLPAHLSIHKSADLKRPLTERGEKQAERMAHWLRQRLPPATVVLSSPAIRTLQTAQALTGQPEVASVLEPGATVSEVLARIAWPTGPDALVLVGHQPWLGNLASFLLAGEEQPWSVSRGGIWWLTTPAPEGGASIAVRAVVNPDLL
jgi:phosphohistidine phosphatase